MSALATVLVVAGLSPVARGVLWQNVGAPDGSKDSYSINIDSITEQDGYRTVTVLTIFAKAQINPNHPDLQANRYAQKDVFDCVHKTFAGISGDYAWNEKVIWTVRHDGNWKDRLTAVPNDALPQAILHQTCAAPVSVSPPTASTAPAQSRIVTGTGVAINTAGDVLTNNHVVAGCTAISVRSGFATQSLATVDVADPKNDLALLKTHLNFPKVAHFRLGTHPITLGESVGVVGYPLSGLLSSEPQATFGEISALAGINNDYSLFQLSAPVQSGNSGSPVLDQQGRVIGIVVSELSPTMTGQNAAPQNVNFAIRAELAQVFLSAHGVAFSHAEDDDAVLKTEQMAAIGRDVATRIVCQRY